MPLFDVFALGVGAALAAETITMGAPFAWLRLCAMKYMWRWFARLLTCGFCLSHWISGAAILSTTPRLEVSPVASIDALATWLFMTAVAVLTLKEMRK